MALITAPLVNKISQLACDKLAFTIPYKSKAEKHEVASALEAMLKLKMASSYGKYPYRRGIRVFEPDLNNRLKMLIQWNPYDENASYVRVDFNPTYADKLNVYATLSEVLPGGLDDLASFAKITRFDAAVDLNNIKPHQLYAYYPQKQISEIYCKSGNIESLYLGKRGQSNMVIIYDKQLQIKEINQKYGLKVPELKQRTTRVEIRMTPECSFAALINVQNPFKKLTLKVESHHYQNEQLWRVFMATVRHRGLQDSLSLLDDATREKFRKRVIATPDSWWKPAEIWKAWPKLVEDLCNPLFPAKYQTVVT